MKKGLIVWLLCFVIATSIFAHPHVFIDIGIEIESMDSAKIMWTFDKIESSNKIYYFDDDEDGTLNQAEANNLYQEGFKSVRDFNYFITFSTSSGQYPLTEISNFDTLINSDGRLTVSFNIDLPKSDDSTLSISHLDTSYFIAFSEPESADIKIPKTLYSTAFKNKDHPIYYDPNAAKTVTLDTSKPKPGWLVAYPTQVVISTKPITGYNQKIKESFQEKIVNIQRVIYQKLSSELIDSKNIPFILLLAFIYGVIHAIGPGHRKIVISSYILSREKTSYLKAGGISFLSALIHSGSGIFIILLLNLIFSSVQLLFVDQITDFITKVSYLSLLVLSLVLIILKSIKTFKQGGKRDEGKPVGLSLIIISSIVPCPGALTIMLFATSMYMIPTGIFTVLAMSLGIGFTLCIISFLTIKGKTSISFLNNRFKYLNLTIEWAGLILLAIFSLLMVLTIPYFT